MERGDGKQAASMIVAGNTLAHAPFGNSQWVRIKSTAGKGRRNAAMRLLRDAIGGMDLRRASANLTVEMEDRGMDDTSVVVITFGS